ncbi:MAG: hypothetical protein Q8J88_11375 [Bacteroidales bacterium]|nr:hypothetical protein [Bacteroidales bacterium]
MPKWTPFLINCPSQILEFFISRNIHFEEYTQNALNENHCIILSAWHPDKTTYWLENLNLLRRTGTFNPVILLSFQTESNTLSHLLFPTEGIYFMRLPFSPQQIFVCTESIKDPDNLVFRQMQHQLCFESVCMSWNNLQHGKSNELLNIVLVPLRMALLLDVHIEEKISVVNQIIDEHISNYWQSPLIKSIQNDSEKLEGKSDMERKIHMFFYDLNALITNAKNLTHLNENEMIKKIDELIRGFKEIDKSLNSNYGT